MDDGAFGAPMEQHVDQHAVLNSMGEAPMASGAGAVVALPVDPAAPAAALLDDVAIGVGGQRLRHRYVGR